MFMAIFYQSDCLQGVNSGILRGLGKTKPASIAGFIGYWVIALPLEYYFALHKGYGVLGLWYGLLFGSVVHAAF
jgi:multidrug resistance protein, MATE family